MRLRDAQDLCSDGHQDDWVQLPGSRPATTMLAGIFDPGASQPETRPLMGDSVAVYEPDARLSIVWPVPEDSDARRRDLPEWAEQDDHDWTTTGREWAVILVCGAPIWQTPIWYLNWGSGIGGYVPNFEPVYGDDEPSGEPTLERWEVSAWAVGLARLLNVVAWTPHDWFGFDPTQRIVSHPSPVHPIDAARRQ
jgi:hypothetical protein